MTVALALTGWATGASASLMSARLRWQPSPAFGVVGYRVYMRTLSGSYGPPADAGLPWPNADGTFDFIMANLDGATSYALAVSAYDAKGVESGLSSEVMLLSGTATSTTVPPTTSTTTTTTGPPTTTTTPTTTTSTTTTTRPPTTTTTPSTPTTTTTTTLPGDCSNPTVIPAQGGTFSGTTSGSSLLAGSCGSSGDSPERVFQWTPAVSGTATIQTCGDGTHFDTVLYLSGGVCANSPEVACNDDTTGCPAGDGGSNTRRHGSRVRPAVTAGTTYFIVVDGHRGAQGQFSLTVTPPSLTAAAGAPNTSSGAAPLDLQVDHLALRGTGKRGRLVARGMVSAPAGVDPTVTGVHAEVRAPNGSILYDASIPAAGFRSRRGHTVFDYVAAPSRGGAPGAHGVQRMRLVVRGDRVEVRLAAVAPEIADATRQSGLTFVLWLGSAGEEHLGCAWGADTSRCRP